MKKHMMIVACALLVSSQHAEAQGFNDCSQRCTESTPCSQDCEDNGVQTTCHFYGTCDISSDVDNDGRPDTYDNCAFAWNFYQEDCDGDGAGDICDGQDGLYHLVESTYCNINSRLHVGYIDQTLYREGLFRDSSPCNSPDEWRKTGESTGYCFAFYTQEECCLNLWNNQLCSALLENNLCRY